jgi:hypothetical protein
MKSTARIAARRRSLFGDSGLAHIFNDPLAPLQENWIVALSTRSIAPDGEPGIERKCGFDFGLCFIEPTKFRQRGGEIETCSGIVWVQLNDRLKTSSASS